jgi:hypothetical protein
MITFLLKFRWLSTGCSPLGSEFSIGAVNVTFMMGKCGTAADSLNIVILSPIVIPTEADSIGSSQAIVTTDSVSSDFCKYMPKYS